MTDLGICGPPIRSFGRPSSGPVIEDVDLLSDGPGTYDTLIRVRGARVVCANYRALFRDFPEIFGSEAIRQRPLPGCDECAAEGRICVRAVNAWLIRNAAFISQQQSLPNDVNTPIALDDHVVRPGYRPPEYGRAAVVAVEGGANPNAARFLDLKGIGVAAGRIPSHAPHSSGLEYLGNALVDFFYGWLIDTVFARTNPGYHVVPVYGVLDLGFDIVGGAFGSAPAGVQIRRAHARPFPLMPMSGSGAEKLMIHAEMLLRLHGLTTANYLTSYRLKDDATIALPDLSIRGVSVPLTMEAEQAKAREVANAIRGSSGDSLDVLNVQLTSDGDWDRKTLHMYDFGHVRAQRRFTAPLATPLRDGALRIGRITAVNDPAFVQPEPAFAIDTDLCDRESASAFGFSIASRVRHSPRHYDQRRVETMLRIARLKVMRRHIDWARRAMDPR